MKRFDRDKFFREIRRNQKIFKQNFERRPRTRVFNYDKYEKLRDGADYIQRVMFDVLQKSDKPKIQRKLALKAFQGRKQLIKMNSQIIDLDTSQLNGIQPSNNDISDNDLSILMSSAATQNTKEMTTITLEKSQSNMNMLALLEAADNTQEDAFRWVEPVEEKEEEKEEDEEENGKKKKKKDPYSLTPTKKIFEDFDRVMEFKIYFTHNNLKEIVKKMNIKQGMKKKKTKV